MGGCNSAQLMEKLDKKYQLSDVSRFIGKLNKDALKIYWNGFKSYKERAIAKERDTIIDASCSRAEIQAQFLEDLEQMKKEFTRETDLKKNQAMTELYKKYFQNRDPSHLINDHRQLQRASEALKLFNQREWKKNGALLDVKDTENNPWHMAESYVRSDPFFNKCYDQYYKHGRNAFFAIETNRKQIEEAMKAEAKRKGEKFDCASAHAVYDNKLAVFDDSVDYQYDTIYSHSFPFEDYNNYRPVSFIGGPLNDFLSEPSLMMLSTLMLFMVCVIILLICCISSMWTWIGCYFVSKEREQAQQRKESMENVVCFEEDIERSEC